MSTMTGNPTYNLTAMFKEILQNHHSVMLTFGISLPEEDIDLPKLYWIPKLHKNPYKQRYIAGSAKCSTKPLSLIITLSMCHFVLVFFSPFSIAITSLGEERANLSAFRTFVRFVLVWICRFPLPLGVWEGLRFVIVALPGLFSYLFLASWGSTNIYPLFTDPSEGRSYPDLGSIPGPFL